MDRQIVYPGAIPLETDLLNTNKYAMIGLAKLASAIFGSNTYVHGLACTASSPASMAINVAAGQIYSLQNIDGTAYSSLAADTTHTILKQGLALDATQFTLTAPGTSGYSINYLVQVTYTDSDSGATVLPYYNATNPSVAWSGPNNSGAAQNTVRSGICTVALKAGVAATTGTQTTPSPDTGYTGLYIITVAQGATTVTSANISVYANAPIINQAGIYDSFQRNTSIYGVDIGVSNAYVVNITPKILSLTDGTEVIFKANNANTTSSTLNVCAIGSFPIISKAGAALIASEIAANSLVKVRWSSLSTSWVLLDATSTFQTAPTAAAGTNNTQIATTAFAQSMAAMLLKISNNLSEIAASGSAAQLAARNNISVYSKAEVDGKVIGVGQTWVGYNSTQRVVNTNYTNDTGRPIMVAITSGTVSLSRLIVDGVTISNVLVSGSTGGNLLNACVVVPAGSVYQFTSSTGPVVWAELR